MTKDEEITLKALQYAASLGNGRIVREMNIAPFIIRCDEALAQPEQKFIDHKAAEFCEKQFLNPSMFLQFVEPEERPWVSLTREEINSALSKYQNWYEFAAHLENILKEKNQ